MNGEWIYKQWCDRLEKHLGIKLMYGIKEYKDEIEYNGVIYKKSEL